ncbi:unnamed protein product [Rhizoctonia solani]|uniref:Protein kinase domain-containing protein n=1 Tax=Rhizoctonia solani TaxID=456999 RepID=A0A8H3B354_9AGAM|nr:unnamed protein product [Rhizoctonia solani]
MISLAASQRRYTSPIVDASEADLVTINGAMPVSEILMHLTNHGCQDVTSQLDTRNSSRTPVSTGGFGDVYLGCLRSGPRVGVKCLRLLIGSDHIGKKQLRRAAHELYVWSKCNHQNVLSLIGVAEYQGCIAMISPWMENGNLSWFLPRHPEVNRGDMCFQIADGVTYLHKEGVVHGDIKGLNILVSVDHIPMITDFGNAAVNDYTLEFAKTTSAPNSTLRWAAPEILEGATKHTKEGDIYSLGMTILEVITGYPPYHGIMDLTVMVKIAKGIHPTRPEEYIPSTNEQANRLWNLLTRCWTPKAHNRPNAASVKQELGRLANEDFWQTPPAIIRSTMSVGQVLAHLGDHGCIDITDELVLSQCKKYVTPNGQSGQVYTATLRNGTRVGLKIVSVAVGTHDDAKSYLKRAAHELYVWSKCRHPSVLELIGVVQYQGQIAMVSPWMENGNLMQFISRNPSVDRCITCSQISDAVAYLHSQDIVHGDIKGSNVLVSRDYMIKLTDFGNGALSEYELRFSNTTAINTVLISRRWAPPEMIANGTKPNYETDTYALGMVSFSYCSVYHPDYGRDAREKTVLEVISGSVPYEGLDEYAACNNIIYGVHPPRPVSSIPPNSKQGDALWSILTKSWAFEPDDRPIAMDIRDELLKINRTGLLTEEAQ